MKHAGDVRGPVPSRIGREPRTDVLVATPRVRDDIERHVAVALAAAAPDGRDRESPTRDEASASSDESATYQRALQVRLEARLQRLVRVPDPGNVGRDIERRSEWTAAFVGYRHAELARDQLRAEI